MLLELTQQEAAKREIGSITGIPVRFFIEALVDDDYQIIEASEAEFLEQPGCVEYERHTVFNNGVSQICLTKSIPY